MAPSPLQKIWLPLYHSDLVFMAVRPNPSITHDFDLGKSTIQYRPKGTHECVDVFDDLCVCVSVCVCTCVSACAVSYSSNCCNKNTFQKQLKDRRFVTFHSYRAQFITAAIERGSKSVRQLITLHACSRSRKMKADAQLSFPILFSPGPQPKE